MKKKLFTIMLIMSLTICSITPHTVLPKTEIAADAAKKKTPSVSKLRKAIEDAYGDNFVANMELTKEEIKERYKIQSSWYSSASAQVPMISAQVDTLIIVKAKNAKTKKKVKKALTEYRQSLIDDTMQYPMNVPKIAASRVYVKDNYVFFIMLGFIDSSIEESDDTEAMVTAYKEQNKIAVDAINALFK